MRRVDTWHRVEGPDGAALLDRLRFARGLATRTKGLLGRRSLPEGEGLAFREKSIHMFFMRMSLDIVFCDAQLQIVRIAHELRPWRIAACTARALRARDRPGRGLAARAARGHGAARRPRLLNRRVPRSSRAGRPSPERDESVPIVSTTLIEMLVRAYGGAGCTTCT